MSELDKKIVEYQTLTKQLELIIAQKAQYMTKQEELKIAQEEVKNLPSDAKVYRLLGGFLVEVDRAQAEKNIASELSDVTARLESIEKQEKRLSDKLTDMRTEIENMVRRQGGA